MGERILNGEAPATRTLVIAGNAHTALTPTMLGVPLGARLAEWRPGVREIRIRYGSGTYYNQTAQRFNHPFSLRRKARLLAEGGSLVLELPGPTQALVPHRIEADQPPAQPSPPGYTGAFTAYRDRPSPPAPRRPASRVPRLPELPAAGGSAGPAGRAPAGRRPARPWQRPAPSGPRPGRPNPYETGLTAR